MLIEEAISSTYLGVVQRVFTYDFKQAKDIQQFNFYFVAHCFMFFY